jgi:hypothetical protein
LTAAKPSDRDQAFEFPSALHFKIVSTPIARRSRGLPSDSSLKEMIGAFCVNFSPRAGATTAM